MIDPQDETLGDRLRRLRRERGLSQEALAHMVGVSKSQVYLVEKGVTRAPHPGRLRAYAAVLGVTMEYLLHGDKVRPLGGTQEWPSLEVYLRETSSLAPEEIIQVARIVHALEAEQRAELAIQDEDSV